MHAPRWLSWVQTVERQQGLALGAVTLLALGVRLAGLDFQPLWWDEGWSVYFAASDVPTLLERTAVDIHPPLYYLLLKTWSQAWGYGVPSLRLLSVLIGMATVPLLFAVGRRLLGWPAGLLAAVLLAFSPLHIYYSQEVRMYGLVTLLSLAALHFALCWQTARRGVGAWAGALGYIFAAAGALYTQYYAAFFLLALNILVLLRLLPLSSARQPAVSGERVVFLPPSPGERPGARVSPLSWLAAQLAVLLLYLPWLAYAGQKLLTYVRFKVSVEEDPSLGLLVYLGKHLAAFHGGHAEGALAPAWWLGLLPPVLLVVALRGSLWLSRDREGVASRFPAAAGGLLATLAIALLCGFAVNLVFPFNPARSERLLLLALPVDLLLVAGGLWVVGRRRPGLAAALLGSFLGVALLSLSFFYTVPRYPADDYRPVAARVAALGLPSDAVLCVHPWQVGYFQAYIPRDEGWPSLVLTPREMLPAERQLWDGDAARLAADLQALLAAHPRLWLADHRAMGRILEEQIEATLVNMAYPVLAEWHGENTVLALFAAAQPVPLETRAFFGDWLSLEGAALNPGPLQAGWDVLTIDLSWCLTRPAATDHVVGLSLVGTTGHVWAQRDAPPQGGLLPFAMWPPDQVQHDHHGLLVPAGTPPGEYRVILRVYDPASLQVAPASGEVGSSVEVVLETVRVTRPAIPPPIEALSPALPLDVELGPLRLVGATVPDRGPLLPGQEVEVDLFWQTLANPGEDLMPRLHILDASGASVAQIVEKPVAGTYPTAWWQAGELVRDPHALPIPATLPPGRYRLALDLARATDGAAIRPQRGPDFLELAEVEVQGREHNYRLPAAQHSQQMAFGPAVELAGYDLSAQALSPGSKLEVILYWHARGTPDRNYHTFVHLLDAAGSIVAQDDGPPANGRLPSLGWLPGEYLADPHILDVPGDLPPGQYRLAVGLYEPVTWERPGERAFLDTLLPAVEEP